jgi:hypothetical protein
MPLSGNNLPKQVAVRVLRLADETTQDMPYKSFNYIKDDIDDVTHQKKFELIGEIDADGNLVPGSPNLQPQHRTEVAQSVSPVVETGEKPAAKVTEVPKVATVTAPVQKKKMGRPAKVVLQETQA